MRFLAVLLLAGLAGAQPAGVDDLQRAFERPPDDCRIMVRWWWFGPAVTRPELDRELRAMKEAGIGGVEVQPVYPLALDNPAAGLRNLPYLSDDFIDALRFAAARARELGLRFDLTLGSGWPYGGPQVPVTRAASRLRIERVQVAAGARRVPAPYIGGGEKLLAAFLDGTRALALTDISGGVLHLPVGLEGAHEVLFFVSSRTGQQVKRAAVNAEGFVLDHYDPVALEIYLRGVGDTLMKAFRGATPPRAIFCDSLEVYGSDWTPDILEQFQKRRGYDLLPFLPALAGAGESAAAVRHDWGQTLSELAEERFVAPLHEWARRQGTFLRMQSYGTPPVTLSSYAQIDLPEGEGAQWKNLSATRWASSASHLYGRPVTSSETWTWLHSPVFRATPLDVKAEADLHFLQGINQLVGHGWPYTAEGVEYPGWRFYAAAVFDEKNPWWIAMPDLSLYLQRVSYMLRQGRPANDVAIYLPDDDAFSQFSPGRVALFEAVRARLGPDVVARVLEAGYGFDFIDDAALRTLDKLPYRVLILPGVERISAATLRRMEEFTRGGGALVATRRIPSLGPGLKADAGEVRELSRRLFESRLVENENEGLAPALQRVIAPDVSLAPPSPDIGFIHRSAGFAEIYFLANSGNQARSARATFRVEGLRPEWWDPMTGRVTAAEVIGRVAGSTTVALELEPYGSRVLVFSRRTSPASQKAGRARTLELSDWRVTFGDSATPVVMQRLHSWTEDEDTRYFSGVAAYEKAFTVPAAFPNTVVRLDFGAGRAIVPERRRNGTQAWLDAPVREAAVVYLNGQRAGSVWCPPYSLDVTKLLKPGENRLRILVGNLAINYMAGRRLPDYRLLNLRYGVRFEPQDMNNLQPIPAGLLGPVRLIGE